MFIIYHLNVTCNLNRPKQTLVYDRIFLNPIEKSSTQSFYLFDP
jgi:hypothetical protein